MITWFCFLHGAIPIELAEAGVPDFLLAEACPLSSWVSYEN